MQEITASTHFPRSRAHLSRTGADVPKSAGEALSCVAREDKESLITHADQAMYRARQSGGNRGST
jgi:GGDEF domain-containing protein